MPESIFSFEPIGLVIANLMAGQPPGFSLEVIFEMNDGTTWNFEQIPDAWKNTAVTQIPNLAGVTIRVRP